MTEHYFSRRPDADHDRVRFEAALRDKTYAFYGDAGVFSKRGVDFGSRLLIEKMVIPAHAEVLDVGCGYGPIGIAAADLAVNGRCTLIDINERAVQLAKENVKENRIRNAEVLQSDLFEKIADRRFTHILTNPPIRAGKQIVHRIFEQAADHLESGGELWVVIQKKQGAPSALAKLQSIYAIVEEEAKDKGYRIYKAVKE